MEWPEQYGALSTYGSTGASREAGAPVALYTELVWSIYESGEPTQYNSGCFPTLAAKTPPSRGPVYEKAQIRPYPIFVLRNDAVPR